MKLPRPRTLAKWFLYNLLVVTALDYAFYLRWVHRLPRIEHANLPTTSRESGLPIELVHALGDFQLAPERRDLRRVPFAHPDHLRVIAIGDSFTFGDEVDAGLDYPALLQKLLRARGHRDVEVLNLGSSWHGFGQAVRLAERLGYAYRPDFILVGPECLFSDRDVRFNHTADRVPQYIHGRWVLDDDGLRFLDPAGGYDDEERKDVYYSFLPRWRYLRYDRNAPSFLRALLPRGRRLANPFYYSPLPEDDEALTIERRLLERLALGAPQVIFIQSDPERVELARELPIVALELTLPKSFPYRRSHGHFGALGNAIVADVFAQALAGERVEVDGVELHDDSPVESWTGARTLETFTGAEVRFGARRIAQLRQSPPEATLGTKDDVIDPAAAKIVALLAVRAAGAPVLEARLIALDRPIAPGTQAELVFPGRRLALGPIRLINAAVQIGVVDIPDAEESGQTLLIAEGKVEAGGTLMIGGRPMMELSARAGAYSFVPLSGLTSFKPGAGDALLLSDLPERGDVTIAFQGAAPLEVKIGSFTKTKRPLPYFQDSGHPRRTLPASR